MLSHSGLFQPFPAISINSIPFQLFLVMSKHFSYFLPFQHYLAILVHSRNFKPYLAISGFSSHYLPFPACQPIFCHYATMRLNWKLFSLSKVHWDWAIQNLHENHHCWMSWPALDKGNLFQPSLASHKKSETSWPGLWLWCLLRSLGNASICNPLK